MPRSTRTVTVEGELRLIPAAQFGGEAKGVVRVRDVSYADAPARIVAETALELQPAEGHLTRAVPFRVTFKAEAGASYGLEGHLSHAGSAQIAPGDYLTVESYPVTAEDPLPQRVVLHAKRI
jgi:uncharacterized lipoprotein YbaY